jgi:hypothetical protein
MPSGIEPDDTLKGDPAEIPRLATLQPISVDDLQRTDIETTWAAPYKTLPIDYGEGDVIRLAVEEATRRARFAINEGGWSDPIVLPADDKWFAFARFLPSSTVPYVQGRVRLVKSPSDQKYPSPFKQQ